MRVWRLRELLSEAARNLVTTLPRSLLIGVAVAGVVGALTWSELETSSRILEFQRGFISSGGNVLVATSTRGIPAYKCSALAGRDVVVASGGLRLDDPRPVNTAPGTLFQIGHATPGVIQVWYGLNAAPVIKRDTGLIVGAAVAEELGLREGFMVGIADEKPMPVASVLSPGGRYPQADRWIIVPTAPVGSIDQCWVEFTPGSRDAGEASLAYLLGGSSLDMDIAALADLDEFSFDPVSELANRPQASAWMVAGSALTVLIALVAWLRRSELGLYRVLGSSRAALWLMSQLEAFLVVILPGVIGFLWALAIHIAINENLPNSDQIVIAARTALSTVLIVLTAAPIAALLIGRRQDLLSQLKAR